MAGDDPIWLPDPDEAARSTIRRFAAAAEQRCGVSLPDYARLWRWSVDDAPAFWAATWDFFDVRAERRFDTVLSGDTMPDFRWFDGARLNYTEQVLRHADRPGPAIVTVAEDGTRGETGWDELYQRVLDTAGALRRAGVRPGDRVVGYLPNGPEAVVGLLATAAIGGIWAVCGQEYGPAAAADRLAQLDPVVLLAADGYWFGGRVHDRREAVRELAGRLPSVQALLPVDHLGTGWSGAETGLDVPATGTAQSEIAQLPAGHPLWVLFSSGTTGRPKGIVHGHAGVLLSHLAGTGLQLDVRAGDRVFMYTSTSWMVWNVLVSGLLLGATIVLYDGDPTRPQVDRLWSIVADEHVTLFVTGPGYLQRCARAGLRPGTALDLSALRQVGSSGSPLPAGTQTWFADAVSSRIPLVSTSGGTDVVGALAAGSPDLPVRLGEIPAPALGVALDAVDDEGHPVRGAVGELVVTRPMPSMPLRLWDDPDGSRYRATYFAHYPGIWRHGDWVTVSARGGVVVHGRSDATLNRNGVRLGSAEVYEVVEAFDEIDEAMVIGVEQAGGGYWMPLFVALARGARLDDELRGRLAAALRTEASPRHVPDEVIAVPGIPHTRTGKKLEVPVKRLFLGTAPAEVASLGAVDDPELLGHFAALAARRAANDESRRGA